MSTGPVHGRASTRGVFKVLDCLGPNGGTLYIAIDRHNRKRAELEVLDGPVSSDDAIAHLEDLLERVDPEPAGGATRPRPQAGRPGAHLRLLR